MKNIVVISAVWCPSCLILNKHLKKLKEEYDINITKLDYDFDDIEEYNVGDKLNLYWDIEDMVVFNRSKNEK